jgi:hypothetical protein
MECWDYGYRHQRLRVTMANELTYRHNATAKTVYVAICDSTHRYWNTSEDAFEVLVVANWSDYVVPLLEAPSGGYLYVGDWPSGLSNKAWYLKELYEQQGASPAIGDTLVGSVVSYWNGSSLVPIGLPTIDGLDPEKVLAAVLATAAGKVTVTDNGDGTYTAVFKRQDGTTTALSVTYNPATGTRAATAVIP